jgi:UDP-GlcNAc:undecaprenyl-phosphate/decaprenyl-phosphate GlcNAc-1-phosphate transferase
MNIDFMPLLISAVSCLILIKLTIPFAIGINLVDKPNSRKRHTGDVPLVGGISMFIAIVIGFLTTQIDLNQQKNILLAMLIVVSVGVLDDHQDLSVKSRVIFHIIASLTIVAIDGVVLNSLGWIFGFMELKLHTWSIFFTVFAIIGVMNAINMSDGIDGLSGSLSLITLLFISYFSYKGGGNIDDLMIALIVCSTLIPFLLFNFSAFGKFKKIFMGDAGTTLLGLIIAILLIKSSQGEYAIFSPVTAIWLLAVPLIDTFALISKRIIKGRSPFEPDREHLHHLFIRSGVSERKTLLIIISLSFSMSFIGSWMELNDIAEWKMFTLFLLLFFLYLFAIMHAWKLMKFVKK